MGSYVAGLEQGRLTLSAGLNYNETTVLGGVILNPSGITTKRVFEEARPKLNATASAVWQAGAWEMTLRARHYGPWLDVSGNSTGELFQEFGSMTLADIAVAYAFNDHLSVKLGAENALDRYPAEALNQANRGLIYSRNAPYDTDGGQYYLRLDLKF